MRARTTLATIHRLRLYQAERAPIASLCAAAAAGALLACYGASLAGAAPHLAAIAVAAVVTAAALLQWRFACDRPVGVSALARGLVRQSERRGAIVGLAALQGAALAWLGPPLLAPAAAYWIWLALGGARAGAAWLGGLMPLAVGLVAEGGEAPATLVLASALLAALAGALTLVHPPRRSPGLIAVLALAIPLACAAILERGGGAGFVLATALLGFAASIAAAASASGRGRPGWTRAATLGFIAVTLVALGLAPLL